MTALLLGVVLGLQQGPPPVTFTHAATNLKFNHPATWKFRKIKDDFRFTVPIKDKVTGQLDIYAVSFMAAPEVWENAQTYFAEQQRLKILKSAREEILGVPLLLMQMQETATPERKITLAGIIYSATEFKMLFRLTAPEADFAEAELIWRDALQSLATLDGKLPEPERPGRATEASAGNKRRIDTSDRTITRLGDGKNETGQPRIGPVKLDLKVANREVQMAAPEGWTLTLKGEQVAATHPNLGGELLLDVRSTLDSAPLSRAFFESSSNRLSLFQAVQRRTETRPTANAAGAIAVRLLREGIAAEGGELSVFQAGAEKAEFYWIGELRSAKRLTAQQIKLLESFVAEASVEKP
jgi:hypothetical protein